MLLQGSHCRCARIFTAWKKLRVFYCFLHVTTQTSEEKQVEKKSKENNNEIKTTVAAARG